MTVFSIPKLPSSLLAKCLACSFVLHSAVLYVLIEYPIAIKHGAESLFIKTKPTSQEMSFQEAGADRALEEFFEEFSVSPLMKDKETPLVLRQAPAPLENLLEDTALTFSASPLLGLPPTPLCSLPPAPFSPSEENQIPLTLMNFSIQNDSLLPKEEPTLTSPLDFLSKDIAVPLIEDKVSLDLTVVTPPARELLFAKQITPTFSLTEQFLFEEKSSSLVTSDFFPFTSETHPKSTAFLTAHMALSNQLIETPVFIPSSSLSNIDDYIPIHSLFSLQWQDDFTITPSFFPAPDGYVFSLTITPTKRMEEQCLKQNFYFFIDVSSQIEKHKASVFKKSVLKALGSLQPNHFFNIFLLGKEITKFSPHNVPFSLETLRRAQDFLDKEQDRAFFASFNLLEKVEEAIEKIEKTDELHTALLLSSGKCTNNLVTRQKKISHILDRSEGKVQLFTAAVGQNNNLFNLDMISSLCGGKLLYSDTNASFPRKLSAFVKSLQSPLIKDLSISVQAEDQKASLELRCPPSHINCLYQNEPLVIMGKISHLCNLRVGIEGRNEEGFILLQKEVNFEEAQESSPSLKKEWALLKTASLYHKFLEEPSEKHLKEAQELLKTTNSRVFRE